MTDEEYHKKMFGALNHSPTCQWGWDQYWWECDCGAIPVAELRVEQLRRRVAKSFSSTERPPTENIEGRQ